MRLLLFNLATDEEDQALGFTSGWIRAIASRTESVDVLTMRLGHFDPPNNVRVHSLGKELGYSEPRRVVEFYRLLSRVLRERKIDACFSHMIPLFTVLAVPLLVPRRVPIVTWYTHPKLTIALRAAHHASAAVVSSLQSSYPYRKDKLTVLGHGIDTELFSPAAENFSDTSKIILFPGRISPIKQHGTLLRALAALRRQGTESRLLIVGGPATAEDEPYLQELRQTVRDLDLSDCVEIRPPVPRHELAELYRRARVVVNLTRSGSADKVVLEALACGRPCVVANEGFRPTLGKWADDLVFPFGDHAALADRLSRLFWRSEAEYQKMCADLRQRTVERHGLERLAERIVGLLEQSRRSVSLSSGRWNFYSEPQ